ncbi:MAG: PfkB family carbohydrate kinase [Lachnospiraceae bacterium]|nr:PfkB family carbohydrate kinase [Lachnospiraceae bacterium]
MKKQYDVMVCGPVSLDINIDYQDVVRHDIGGAVVASGFAAGRSGNKTAIFCKLNPKDADVEERFAGSGADLYWKESSQTCSIRNKYFTANKEKRECTSLGKCDPFLFSDLPDVDTKMYHFAGLVYGDFDNELIKEASVRGKVALDIQCMLRHVEDDKSMKFHDWAEKKEMLPFIDYLKTDAAEAEILTGTDDREKAAKMLYEWGAGEIMISHNTEILVYDGKEIHTCPIKARNLSGRTGRGDTVFAGYINERQRTDIDEALLYSTALVSLKMETPGPFMGSRQDVLNYSNEFYR